MSEAPEGDFFTSVVAFNRFSSNGKPLSDNSRVKAV
jgi:hypothetical protein